ncbi:MAG TPA: thioredoxin family protein [Terracidiphilus sp.]|nr:thioredoxin family protein [Terracidiphilus sp.]
MHNAWVALLALALPAAAVPAATATSPQSATEAPHVHVELLLPAHEIGRDGKPNSAGLFFKLEPGWHVYWKNAGDSGEPPHVKWTMPAGIKASELQFPAPKRLPLGPFMDFGYEDQVVFPFTVTAGKSAARGPSDLHAKVDWLVCREVCIPGKAELALGRTVSDHASGTVSQNDLKLIERFEALLPKTAPATFKPVFQASGAGFRVAVTTGRHEATAAFFPSDQSIVDNPSAQTIAPTDRGLILGLKKDANLTANPDQLRGVIELSDGRAFEITAVAGVVAGGVDVPSAPAASATGSAPVSANSQQGAPLNPSPTSQTPSASLLRSAAFAFLGGLLLNLMPCVFPVLFIKALALVRSGGEERHTLRSHGFVYAAGILVSFWALVAVLLGLRAAGSHLGWGYQFQSPVFLALMASLLFFLGLSLAGQFEIGLTLTSAGGSLATKQGYTGSFFTGVLAVIVATPCTAPFMGAAVGYALAQSLAITFAVFTALGLGLAAPYVALTLQPAWTRFLPKPGAWMELLKQATAVPVFATVIWLAWVLAQAYGATLLAALLASFLLIAVAGWFLGRWPAKGWASAVAALLLLGVVLLSLVAPGRLAATQAAIVAAPGGSTHAAWEPWSAETVSRYQAQGRPVFVDFTASWCLSCQVNERVALTQPEVQKAFGDANVALLKADWTQHDEAIGDTLAALGRSGVPAYVLYVPGESNPRLLPEVLTPGIVLGELSRLPHAATQNTVASSNLK